MDAEGSAAARRSGGSASASASGHAPERAERPGRPATFADKVAAKALAPGTRRAAAKATTKRKAAVKRARAARATPLRVDTRTPEEKAVQHAIATHTRGINDQRRRHGRDRTAVARAKRQVKKVAAAVHAGELLPDAPEILADPTEPLSMDVGVHIAAKLKAIGARLRDGSLRGDKDPVTGRSIIPPAQLLSLPGVQALSLAVRFLPGGRDRFIDYVQLGALNADETCLKFWQIWAELTPAERLTASFDDVVAAGGIKPADLMAAVVKHAMNFGTDVGRLVYAAAHPQVIDASITSALQQDSLGQAERFRLLEAHGVLPIVQKGPMVAISASATAQAGAMAGALGGGSHDAPMLTPFQSALRAAGQAREAVVERVILEHDQRTETRGLIAAPAEIDPFAAAMAAGVDARETETITISSAILGQKAG